MKSPLKGSLLWYILGIVSAIIPGAFFLAATDDRPVFMVLGSTPPDFWTSFWNNFPNDFVSSIVGSGLVFLITTPLYILLRFFFRFSTCPLIYIFATAWLAGFINFCLTLYVLNVGGTCVKSVPGQPLDWDGFLRNFMDSDGIFLLPFITTLISFLPGLLVSRFFKTRTVA